MAGATIANLTAKATVLLGLWRTAPAKTAFLSSMPGFPGLSAHRLNPLVGPLIS